jgi:hypothetical protein
MKLGGQSVVVTGLGPGEKTVTNKFVMSLRKSVSVPCGERIKRSSLDASRPKVNDRQRFVDRGGPILAEDSRPEVPVPEGAHRLVKSAESIEYISTDHHCR